MASLPSAPRDAHHRTSEVAFGPATAAAREPTDRPCGETMMRAVLTFATLAFVLGAVGASAAACPQMARGAQTVASSGQSGGQSEAPIVPAKPQS
jgi:hypothetical protein